MILCASMTNGAAITFLSVNGISDGTDYVGPYTIQIDGATYQSMCYDFVDTVAIGQVWQANLLGLDNLNSSYFSTASDYDTGYHEIAWLFTQLLLTTDPATQIDIQHAAWSIFDEPQFHNDMGAAVWRMAAHNATDQGYPGFDFSSYRLVESPQGQPRVQGLIVNGFGPSTLVSPVPESGTCLMLGCGLLMLGMLSRRPRRT